MNKKIVLDTNCLVQMISMHSPYRPAWQAFREGKYLLCVSNDILNEYNEILEKVANAAVAHNIVNAIARSPYTRMFDPHFRFGLIEQDPDDNKFVDCAIVAGAEYYYLHNFQSFSHPHRFRNTEAVGMSVFSPFEV